MAWTPLLLLSSGPRSLSQPVLTQPPSASASLGASAKLTCTLSSGYSSYYVDWYQQVPGKGPRFLMRLIYSTNSRPSGVPARFSGSISGNKAALTITGAQVEDEADYYCALGSSGVNTVMQTHGEVGPKPPHVLRGLSP
uniref:Ig-like domain-containing protein n=1 Tax=Catagonus wagneri TaxID=51154 RepID=A0A8C3W7V8_9CETA